MDKVVVEKEVAVVPDGDGGTGSNAIWAIAFIIVVAIIVGALYYSGILRRAANPPAQKINVEVQAPAANK